MEFPEAILFDLDGVLLDTEDLISNAWRETSKKYNYYLSNEKLNVFKGRRKIDCAKMIIEWINKEVSIEELLSIQKIKFGTQITKANPFQGAKDLI